MDIQEVVILDNEREQMVHRVMSVWEEWAPDMKLMELTNLQRTGVINLMLELQRREIQHWGIKLPPVKDSAT